MLPKTRVFVCYTKYAVFSISRLTWQADTKPGEEDMRNRSFSCDGTTDTRPGEKSAILEEEMRNRSFSCDGTIQSADGTIPVEHRTPTMLPKAKVFVWGTECTGSM